MLVGCMSSRDNLSSRGAVEMNKRMLGDIMFNQRNYLESNVDVESRLNYSGFQDVEAPWVNELVRSIERVIPGFNMAKEDTIIVLFGMHPPSGDVLGNLWGDDVGIQFHYPGGGGKIVVNNYNSNQEYNNSLIRRGILRAVEFWDIDTITREGKGPFHGVIDGIYFIASRYIASRPSSRRIESVAFYEWAD